jgi:1-deoxy-D-xylulose-5-phosphate synthase
MTLMAPRDSLTLEYALELAVEFNSPLAIRYPRGAFKSLQYPSSKFIYGKGEILKSNLPNSDIAIIGYGAGVTRAIETEKLCNQEYTIVDLKFLKPLDNILLLNLAKQTKKWYVFSDSQKQAGVGSAILEFISEEDLNIKVKTFEYDDIYIQHGDTQLLEEELGILPEQLVTKII